MAPIAPQKMIRPLLNLFRGDLGCTSDSAVKDGIVAPYSARATWGNIPSPAPSTRYAAIRNIDIHTPDSRASGNSGNSGTPAAAMLQRDYQECRDHLEKECRLAQSRTKVAMRIHAREQDVQRKVNVALARAKRAEGLVTALRHENASLRAKLKMLSSGDGAQGLNPSASIHDVSAFGTSGTHFNNTETETATTKKVALTPKTKWKNMMLRGDPAASVDTPPTQRGSFVARKMVMMGGGRSGNDSSSTSSRNGSSSGSSSSSSSAERETKAVTSSSTKKKTKKTTKKKMKNTTTTTTTAPTQGVSFLNAISSDLPRLSGIKTYAQDVPSKNEKKRAPLQEQTNLNGTNNSWQGHSDIQTVEF